MEIHLWHFQQILLPPNTPEIVLDLRRDQGLKRNIWVQCTSVVHNYPVTCVQLINEPVHYCEEFSWTWCCQGAKARLTGDHLPEHGQNAII